MLKEDKNELISLLKPYRIKYLYSKKKTELRRLLKKKNKINEQNKLQTSKKKINFAKQLTEVYEFEKYNDIVSEDYALLENNPGKWMALIDGVNEVMNVYNIWNKDEIENFLENDFRTLSSKKKKTLKKNINKFLKFID